MSYETLLDQFLLCNFFLLVAMAIVSALLPQAGREVEELADRVSLALLGAVWCLIQAWFVAKAWSRNDPICHADFLNREP